MQVGMAVTDITPDRPIYLAGFGPDRLSTGVYHELSATCLVFDNGRTRSGIMALDLLTVDDFLLVPIREAARRVGIPPEAMLVNTCHTHTGPVTERVRSPIRKFDESYLAWLRARLYALVVHAASTMQEATLDYCVGSCTAGVNRRRPPGGCALLPNPSRPIDPDVPVLRVLNTDGSVRAVIFSYACHLSNNNETFIGVDYAGFARDMIQAKVPGCVPVFLQGCGGDIKLRAVDPMTKRFSGATVNELASMGQEVGRAVCTALCGEPMKLDGRLAGVHEIIELPFDHQPTEEELAAAERSGGLGPRWAEAARETIAREGKLIETLPVEIQALALGDLVILGSAAETCVELGLKMKAQLADLPVLTLGYSNGSWDYVAPAEAFAEKSYEGVWSHMDTVWPWPKPLGLAPEAGDLLVEKSVALARGLPKR